jgi:S1-C subfamily serine protease
VLAYDKKTDLALVQIVCGLYHQPLPKGYRFPAISLGDPNSLEIGDKVSTVGFPDIANTNGRASVTLTQGVLSGFEKSEIGVLMKTDAGISPGSSGGAALDERWRLIGVPTFESVSPEEVSRMAYIHPITLLPEAWRKMIRKREKVPGHD